MNDAGRERFLSTFNGANVEIISQPRILRGLLCPFVQGTNLFSDVCYCARSILA